VGLHQAIRRRGQYQEIGSLRRFLIWRKRERGRA
jgi:hypothetical protein